VPGEWRGLQAHSLTAGTYVGFAAALETRLLLTFATLLTGLTQSMVSKNIFVDVSDKGLGIAVAKLEFECQDHCLMLILLLVAISFPKRKPRLSQHIHSLAANLTVVVILIGPRRDRA
jgi:hypothetical protein